VNAVTERIERRVWRDPVLQNVWVLEFFGGHIVGYAGPIRRGERTPDLGTLRFERDAGFLRGLGERFERYPDRL
jgi:hypothetical protein